ncbi:MAG TPA: TMEM175 family protein [Acidimicrobiia bacterium]|nr:TMEM175 family protein [Acidimicrobiia bacterium]
MKFDTGTDRLEIFSDAVIAIAITLLVLDIKVPHSRSGHLVHDLLHIWPSYVAYALSFAVIGIMWVSHHSMFERIQHVDRLLLFFNLWLLLGIGFLPFPTALLAEYARQGGSNSHWAAAVYSATMMFIGFGFLAIWLHLARRPHLLGERATSASVRRSVNLSLVSPIVYGASIGLAFISAEACFVVYGLAALYFAAGPSSKALSRLLERSTDAASDTKSAKPVASAARARSTSEPDGKGPPASPRPEDQGSPSSRQS